MPGESRLRRIHCTSGAAASTLASAAFVGMTCGSRHAHFQSVQKRLRRISYCTPVRRADASSMTSRPKRSGGCHRSRLVFLVAQPCILAHTRKPCPCGDAARGGRRPNHSRPLRDDRLPQTLQISRGAPDLQPVRHVMARATRERYSTADPRVRPELGRASRTRVLFRTLTRCLSFRLSSLIVFALSRDHTALSPTATGLRIY